MSGQTHGDSAPPTAGRGRRFVGRGRAEQVHSDSISVEGNSALVTSKRYLHLKEKRFTILAHNFTTKPIVIMIHNASRIRKTYTQHLPARTQACASITQPLCTDIYTHGHIAHHFIPYIVPYPLTTTCELT